MRKFLLLPGMVLLSACSGGNGSDSQPLHLSGDTAIAETVNGIAVPQVLVESVARARGLDLTKPEQRAQVLKLVTDYVLLAQLAQHDNFFNKPEFAADVEVARLQGVANATIAQLQLQTPLTEAVVKAEYEAQVGRAGKLDFDFSQLLFANETDALKAEGDVLTGKPFDKIYDAWKSSAKQAKTFTRIRGDQLPEPLTRALSELKDGETSKIPVKTQFGWHVVHRDIANPYTPPPFDQVKDGIRRNLLLKIGQERLEKLKEQAKIEYPPGVVPPATTKSVATETAPPAEAAKSADKGEHAADEKPAAPVAASKDQGKKN